MGLLQFLAKWNGLFSDKPIKIMMLGLDNTGKTTILFRLKTNERIETIPTVGFNAETITAVKGVTIALWDVGSSLSGRKLWPHYCQDAAGLVYVVDSTDKNRIEEASEELDKLLQLPEMKGVPLVVMANKLDKPNATSCDVIVEALHLRRLKDRNWFIHPTSAANGEGLHEAMRKLVVFAKKFQKKRIMNK